MKKYIVIGACVGVAVAIATTILACLVDGYRSQKQLKVYELTAAITDKRDGKQYVVEYEAECLTRFEKILGGGTSVSYKIRPIFKNINIRGSEKLSIRTPNICEGEVSSHQKIAPEIYHTVGTTSTVGYLNKDSYGNKKSKFELIKYELTLKNITDSKNVHLSASSKEDERQNNSLSDSLCFVAVLHNPTTEMIEHIEENHAYREKGVWGAGYDLLTPKDWNSLAVAEKNSRQQIFAVEISNDGNMINNTVRLDMPNMTLCDNIILGDNAPKSGIKAAIRIGGLETDVLGTIRKPQFPQYNIIVDNNKKIYEIKRHRLKRE